MSKICFILILFVCLTTGYGLSAQVTVSYTPSTEDFVNPERGFYRYTETRSGNYNALDANVLATFRDSYTAFGADYSIKSSLAFRYFFLEDFTGGPISQVYLDAVAADFAAARTAGIKLIPRFAYTDNVDGDGCGSFICPPYGDAPKSVVLNHISQLAPLLEANKDVIAVVQMGFIGTWGENFYTDFFGDASVEGQGQLFDANWNDRNEVLGALLAAVPAERMVQVRYPQQKQRYVYGVDAPASSAPLTATEAHSGTDKARLGFHNDCLLASPADFGTFTDYGNDAGGSGGDDTATFKPYFAEDSRYVVVGGETCADAYSPQNDCAATNGQAFGDTELRRMHYTYLNTDFNQDVNNDWETGGCMDAIKLALGYRLELTEGTFPASAQAGSPLAVGIDLRNVGYAATFNARGLELILRETTSGEIWRVALEDDPRTWQPENETISLAAAPCLPAGMPAGNYDYLLHLPDPMPTLYGRADYSIRLANQLSDGTDVWEPATGFNKLGPGVSIVAGGPTGCSGPVFVADNLILPLELTDFTATARKTDIRLNWTTELEEGVGYFALERREGTADFREIYRLPAANAAAADYTFSDTEVTVGTDYYYRLRGVDQDGSETVSGVVTARLNGRDQGFAVYPNPTSGALQMRWTGDRPGEGTVTVYTLLGEVVLRSALTPLIQLNGLTAGTYLVKVEAETGRWMRRVVVR